MNPVPRIPDAPSTMIAWPAPLVGRCSVLACRPSASRSRCISAAVAVSIQAPAVVAGEAKSAIRLAALSALIRSRMVRCRFRYLRVSGRILMRSSNEPTPAPSSDESGRMTVPRCRPQTCARPAAVSLVSVSSGAASTDAGRALMFSLSTLPLGFLGIFGTPTTKNEDTPELTRTRLMRAAAAASSAARRVCGVSNHTPRLPLCSSTAMSDMAGSSEIRLVISAISTRLPEILTTASLRPENIGKPSASRVTRSAVANARRREPSLAVTVPKLLSAVPR